MKKIIFIAFWLISLSTSASSTIKENNEITSLTNNSSSSFIGSKPKPIKW